VTHEEHLVSDMISAAIPMVAAYLNLQPRERRLRLDGLQQIVDEVIPLFEVALFQVCVDWVSARAELAAGTCRICRARTRRETKPVTVRLKRFSTVVKVVRFRCRSCKMSWSPVRQWLGLQSGMTTAGLDRALTALSTEMSFGRTAKQMEEQHGHPVNRTLVERRTYAVGKEAMEFLAERRKARRDEVMDAVGHRQGVDRVLLQVDGGGVPVGKLERPPPGEATERTPVRNLPKGRRPKSKREVRVSMAWEWWRPRRWICTSLRTTTPRSPESAFTMSRSKLVRGTTLMSTLHATWRLGTETSLRSSSQRNQTGPCVPTSTTRWSMSPKPAVAFTCQLTRGNSGLRFRRPGWRRVSEVRLSRPSLHTAVPTTARASIPTAVSALYGQLGAT
jgi:hypothetical protein